jgi:hypothetical protein
VKEEAVVETPGRLELASSQAPQHILCVGCLHVAWCMPSRKAKVGLERTHIAPSSSATLGVCSASRRESVLATVLSQPY